MGKANFSEDFTRDAVAQITVSGCGSLATSVCQCILALHIEEEVLAAFRRR